MSIAEVLKIISAGGDVITIIIAVVLFKHEMRISALELINRLNHLKHKCEEK